MQDKSNTPEPNKTSIESTNTGYRVGVRMRGRSQFNGKGARIVNQNLAVDMDDDSQWNGDDPTIEGS